MKTAEETAQELAHRTCTKYLHVPDSSSIQYSFSARHLADFVEKLIEAVDAERGKDAVGYDEIFNAIAEAASPCGEGIGVSVKAFKRAIGGEIFLSPTIPEGWKLLKDTTQEERSWPEDSSHENGAYYNLCYRCGRTFIGHKRRGLCKVCAELAAGVTK